MSIVCSLMGRILRVCESPDSKQCYSICMFPEKLLKGLRKEAVPVWFLCVVYPLLVAPQSQAGISALQPRLCRAQEKEWGREEWGGEKTRLSR